MRLYNLGMKIGYARVSTERADLALQHDALQADGCDVVYDDKGVSGTAMKRPGLAAALAAAKAGDTLTVWRIDRLGRTTAGLALLLDDCTGAAVEFHSIMDGMDTRTAAGKALYGIMSVLAQLERDLISERTKAGLKAAKRRGKRAGRPPSFTRGEARAGSPPDRGRQGQGGDCPYGRRRACDATPTHQRFRREAIVSHGKG